MLNVHFWHRRDEVINEVCRVYHTVSVILIMTEIPCGFSRALGLRDTRFYLVQIILRQTHPIKGILVISSLPLGRYHFYYLPKSTGDKKLV